MGANALNTANMTYVRQVQYTLTTKVVQEDDIYIKVQKKKKSVLKRVQRNVYLNVSHDIVIDFFTRLCMNMSLGELDQIISESFILLAKLMVTVTVNI